MEDLLLVIDMQNVYTEGQKWECEEIQKTADLINKVIDSGKCKRVIFTKYVCQEKPKGNWKKYNEMNREVNENHWANEIMDAFHEKIGVWPVYEKNVYSSYSVPELACEVRNADRVVITGVVAECCVLSTIFQLIDTGVEIIYLNDGVAGMKTEKKKAVELILSGFEPMHLKMMETDTYLSQEGEETDSSE